MKKIKVRKLIKLDFGCGPNPREGFEGVDVRDFGQKYRVDLTKKWPWGDGSVEEAHASHLMEHFEPAERIHFTNELYRVLTPEGKCTVVTPHWSSCRAYGDLTHKWPPVSEFWWYYLSEAWRKANAPHNDGYKCNFEATWGYTLRPELGSRNQEFQSFAVANYKEAIMDMVATLVRKPMEPVS